MKHTVYYIVRPKTDLLRKIAGTTLSNEHSLNEPTFWTHAQTDRVAWSRDENFEAVKLLFLASLLNSVFADVLAEKLGVDTVNNDCFDRYWELEHFEGYDDRVEDVIEELRGSHIEKELKAVNQFLSAVFGVERVDEK